MLGLVGGAQGRRKRVSRSPCVARGPGKVKGVSVDRTIAAGAQGQFACAGWMRWSCNIRAGGRERLSWVVEGVVGVVGVVVGKVWDGMV